MPRRIRRVAAYKAHKSNIHCNAPTAGIQSLPVEIIDIIVSYIPAIPVPYTSPTLLTASVSRCRTIAALSQTCRWLRFNVAHLTWHSIEVCHADLLKPGDNHAKVLATELVRQAEIVSIRNPAFSSLITTVTVSLTDYAAKSVYAEFARCLSCLHNLGTLQIIHVPSERRIRRLLVTAFSEYKYRSVHTLVLHDNAADIMESFPQAQDVLFHSREITPQLHVSVPHGPAPVCYVHNHCPNVTRVAASNYLTRHATAPTCYQYLSLRCPKLEVFPMHFDVRANVHRSVSDDEHSQIIGGMMHAFTKNFQHLRTIYLLADSLEDPTESLGRAAFETAKTILRQPSQAKKPRYVYIQTWPLKEDSDSLRIIEVEEIDDVSSNTPTDGDDELLLW